METSTIKMRDENKNTIIGLSQNISTLYRMLSSNALIYNISNGLSILFETVLYFVFAATIYFASSLPTDINVFFPVGKDLNFIVGLDFERYSEMILVLKSLLLILSLPILGFAITLRRCRKKEKLIHKAFSEVIQMKNRFEGIDFDANSRE